LSFAFRALIIKQQTMTSPAFDRIQKFAPVLLVMFSAVIAIFAYIQALDYPFLIDDASYTIENHELSVLHLSELWRLFIRPYNEFGEFLPLRDLSYWIDLQLSGTNPAAYRVHNIILYLLCLPLIYATTLNLWRYFRPTSDDASWAAAAVTALFALHPAHVEAVVWISGRKDVLSGLFSLLALWFAVNVGNSHSAPKQGLSARYAVPALLALLAAMLSKATAVAVAPLIALLWIIFWCDMPKQHRRYARLLWALASLLLAAGFTLVFTAHSAVKEPVYLGVEAVTRALAVLGWLARLAISPASRHFFYPVFEDSYLAYRVALGVVVIAAAVIGAVLILRRRSLEGFCLVAFLLLCMPYTQLFPFITNSLVADRFLSLPVWPAMLLVVALAWRLQRVPRTMLLVVIALAGIYQTVERPRDWHSFETLIDADLRAFPGYAMPASYQTINQYTHGLVREALQTAGTISDPELRDVMVDLVKADSAVTYTEMTRDSQEETMTLLRKLWLDHKEFPAQAKWNTPVKNLWVTKENMFSGEWMRLLASFPDDMSVRYNAGSWMLDAQKYRDAIMLLRDATGSPGLPMDLRGAAYERLGVALIKSGQVAEAESPLVAALKQTPPELRAYCSLAKVYQQSGRLEQATRASMNCPSGASQDIPGP